MPKSVGLFQRAIIDSSCDEPALSAVGRPIPEFASFAATFSCKSSDIDCLRAIPAAELNAALNAQYANEPYKAQHWFYPLWDASEWPSNATSMLGQWNGGQFASKVPLMFGSTLDEKVCRRETQL